MLRFSIEERRRAIQEERQGYLNPANVTVPIAEQPQLVPGARRRNAVAITSEAPPTRPSSRVK